MAHFKEQQSKGWLDEGIRHLKLLCEQAIECADKGDILPTENGVASAIKLMSEFSHAPVPTMALTVNGEIALTWENTGDSFEACVKTDGSVLFFRNREVVTKSSFTKYLNTVAA